MPIVLSSVSVLVGGVVAASVAAVPTASAAAPTCRGEVATIVGTSGDDTLTGTRGRDVIVGLAGSDTLAGLGGSDLICGNQGADTLRGGAGSDVLVPGRGGDLVRGHAGDDLLYLRHTAGADRVHGGAGDDEVFDVLTRSEDQLVDGGPGRNTLELAWRIREGGEVVPVDVLTDFAAGEAVLGDTGVTVPVRSFRVVRSLLSEGTWSVVGTDGPDTYVAAKFMSIHASTGGGRDLVRGSWHDDEIDGGPGRDTAYADRGRDLCRSVERGPLEQCETLA